MQEFIPFSDFTPSNTISDNEFEIILNNTFKKNTNNVNLLAEELRKHWKNNNTECYIKALKRWKLKKKSIQAYNKKILYHSRSVIAINRPRVSGRFVKKVSTN